MNETFLVLLYCSNERLGINVTIKCIRGRSIKIVQSFVALVKLEYGIWSSVYERGRFVFGTHGKSELTSNINEGQNFGNGIWVV